MRPERTARCGTRCTPTGISPLRSPIRLWTIAALSQNLNKTWRKSNLDLTHRRGEDRLVQTTARRGQAFFLSAVLSAYDRRCCVTGLSIPTLLIASHIVPWTHDETNRLNPENGLLLSPFHDRAFDRGLITIDEGSNLGNYILVYP